MYRIELSPGEETVFRSIEELAVAIKRGVVTSRARIYHNASSRWLPIQFHPHYKAALSMQLTQAALVAGPPVKPLSTLRLQEPVAPEPLSPPPAPAFRLTAPVDAPAPRKPIQSESSGRTKRSRRAGKPRRQLRIALVGALLVGGAQWVLSAPLFSRADAPVLLRVQRQLIATPTEAMQRVSSPNTAAMIPVLPNSTASSPSPSPQVEEPDQPRRAQVPSFGGSATAEAEAIEPAPPAPDVSTSPLPSTDPPVKVVDSTAKNALKGILRSVSGARPTGKPSTTR
jgi:hypothetical protein